MFDPPPKVKVGVEELVTVRIGDSEYTGVEDPFAKASLRNNLSAIVL